MPWRERDVAMERADFIKRLNSGEKMTDLCREFGISRKTGYKFKDRYQKYGFIGLADDSRAPIVVGNKTSPSVEQLIVSLRKERPTWGAAKIGEMLRRQQPNIRVPVRSTIHEILSRNGLIKSKRRKKYKASPTSLREALVPNDLWCADFKGQFRLGNKSYCYPLTITDQASRYIITCEALSDTKAHHAIPVFLEAFQEYGIPQAMRTDNGAPFSTRGLLGLSELSILWLKLGIEVERITPGKPQQNGRHERMHLTLKQETTRPPGANSLQQQDRFDKFRADFNGVRPHEALGMETPKSIYKKSEHPFDGKVPDPEYSMSDHICYVNYSGKVYVPGVGDFNLTTTLKGEYVGITQVDEDLWEVCFFNYLLGEFDSKEGIFLSADGVTK